MCCNPVVEPKGEVDVGNLASASPVYCVCVGAQPQYDVFLETKFLDFAESDRL